MNVHDFTVKDLKGNEVELSSYKGKVLLIVNTATECGFTPQYTDLQNIYNELSGDNFEILDFPCNQFGQQAPGTEDEIHTFCTGRFGITFPQFGKVDVNGENAAPLFKWLTESTSFEGFGDSPKREKLEAYAEQMDPDFRNNGNIKWNFTKFLIDKNGEIVARFEPTNMEGLAERIKDCL